MVASLSLTCGSNLCLLSSTRIRTTVTPPTSLRCPLQGPPLVYPSSLQSLGPLANLRPSQWTDCSLLLRTTQLSPLHQYQHPHQCQHSRQRLHLRLSAQRVWMPRPLARPASLMTFCVRTCYAVFLFASVFLAISSGETFAYFTPMSSVCVYSKKFHVFIFANIREFANPRK